MKRILIALLLSSSAGAITPEKLRENVLKNFPLIEEAVLKAKASEAGIMAAEGEFDHKLKFQSRNRVGDIYDNQYFEGSIERNTGVRGIGLVAGHRQGLGYFPVYEGKYETSGSGQIYAGITIPLLRDASTDPARTNLAMAKLENAQAEVEVKMKQNMYIHKALSLYYKWIAEDRILRINKELLELALEREEMLKKRHRRGDIEKVKLTDNERSIEKRRAEIQKVEAKLKLIESELFLFLDGTEKLSEFSDSELNALRRPSVPRSVSLETLPQLRFLNLELEKNRLQEKLYEQSRLPGLGVEVIGARELSGNSPNDPDRMDVGVRFDFPIENRKARGRTVEQSYKSQALEKRRTYTERELKLNFDNAIAIIDINFRRFETTSSEVEKTRTMAAAERTRFEMGSSDLFVVNLRELDVADAEIRKWTTWYEFHQATLDARLFANAI